MNGFPTVRVEDAGGAKDPTLDLRGLSQEQKSLAERMISDSQRRDIYNAISTLTKAVNQTGSIIGGIDSDDMEINHNPASGRSVISIKRQVIADAVQQLVPTDGLPDPTGQAAEMALYIRDVTLSGGVWSAVGGGTVIKVGTPTENTAKAWVIDYLRAVVAEAP